MKAANEEKKEKKKRKTMPFWQRFWPPITQEKQKVHAFIYRKTSAAARKRGVFGRKLLERTSRADARKHTRRARKTAKKY